MKILVSARKKELIFLALLATVILFTRYVLLINLETLYYVDSYAYVNNAILISQGQMNQSLRGYPFIFILGVIVKLFAGLVDPINSAIILMITCNVALIFILYLLSRQFFNAIPAFFTALFASLQTNLILYSLVPYLEIFAYLCGFSSLYILVRRFSELNLKIILLGLFLCTMSILTRFEMLIVFFIPLTILLLINGLLYKNNRKLISLVIISSGFSIFLFYPQLHSYYSGVTRFDPIHRLFLALRWDILTNAFNSVFNITSNELLNMSFKAILLFGFLYVFFTKLILKLVRRQEHHESKFGFFRKLINYFGSKAQVAVLSLSISFLILLIVTVTYYSVSYKITDGELIITPRQISSRFLIGPQLYLSWLFVYSLSKIAEQIFRVISLVHKRIKKYIYGVGKPVLNSGSRNLFYVFLLIVLIFPFVHNTWAEGATLSKNASQTMGLYRETSRWLATNLKENEVAIVPLEVVFHILNADLRNKTVTYKFFWDKLGVALRANNTIEEYYLVQDQLVSFIEANGSVKYVVVDWMDAYCKPILYYSLGVQNELVPHLKKVHEEALIRPDQWVPRIRVYEVVRYASLFSMDFSVPPEQFSLLPRAVLVQYDSDGATIHKADPCVGFYLPLEEGINASKQNYLTMQFRFDVENLELQLLFYYDKNRDDKWSGYEIDYVKSATFNLTKLGWAAGEWHTIYQPIPHADDPVVQIGIILMGDKNGTVTLKNLAVYTEIPFEN